MKNFETYQENLNKSLKEKMFFLSHIDISSFDLIVDYGCGNGAMLKQLRVLAPKATLIGYDHSKQMIDFCLSECAGLPINFTDSWRLIKENLNNYKNKLIIFSSVLHENSEKDQKMLIYTAMLSFDTVVIRDMRPPLNNEPISNSTRKRVLKQVGSWQAQLFENKWGKITNKEQLYRFFLMNEFVDNFETEVEEDYFGVVWEEIDVILTNFGYLKFSENYTLPYRKKQVEKRFQHKMQDFTHRNAIYYKPMEEKNANQTTISETTKC